MIKFKYREITQAEWQDYAKALDDEFGFFTCVTTVDSQNFNPKFSSIFGENKVSFSQLFEMIAKHGNGLKKYEVSVYKNKTKLKQDFKIGDIMVRRYKNNHSGEPYSAIEVSIDRPGVWYQAVIPNFMRITKEKLKLEELPVPPNAIALEELGRRLKSNDLRSLVLTAFREKRYDAALGAASAHIEKTLRVKLEMNGAIIAPTDSGAELARLAFHNDLGILEPPYPVAAQANHGAFLLIQGFMFYIRNGFLHNQVDNMDPGTVADLLCMCDATLALINASQKRE